jgi:hypothetical protein
MPQQEALTMIGKDYAGDAKHKQSPEVLQAENSRNNLVSKTSTKENANHNKAQPKRQSRHLNN